MHVEVGRHRGMMANENIRIGSNSYEKVKTFIRLDYLSFKFQEKNLNLNRDSNLGSPDH